MMLTFKPSLSLLTTKAWARVKLGSPVDPEDAHLAVLAMVNSLAIKANSCSVFAEVLWELVALSVVGTGESRWFPTRLGPFMWGA
jgi:hypothetical protein